MFRRASCAEDRGVGGLLPFASPAAEVDSGEHDFGVAAACKPFGFRQYPLRLRRTGLSTNARNDTKGTTVVAAVLDFEVWPRPVSCRAFDGGGEELILIEDVSNVHLGVIGRWVFGYDVADAAFVGIAHNPVDALKASDFLRRALSVTASDQNAGIGVFSLCAADEIPQVLVGGGGDRAGVEDDQVRGCAMGQAFFSKAGLKGGTVSLRGAASEILNMKGLHPTSRLTMGLLMGEEFSVDTSLDVGTCSFAK